MIGNKPAFTHRRTMIGKLTGTLSDKNPPQAVVDCGGVGYEVQVPMGTFYNLPALGEKVSLLTHFVVREDAQILYGFGSAQERAAFRELIKISGVGPRTALSVLSGMSVEELAQAVTQQEAGRIIKVPGIGKKTAERLLLELGPTSTQTSNFASSRSLAMYCSPVFASTIGWRMVTVSSVPSPRATAAQA